MKQSGDHPVTEYTITDFRSFMAWLRTDYKPRRPNGNDDPLSSGSLFNAWKSIRAFYMWLHTEYQIPRPDLEWKRPQFEYREIIPFTREEITSLLSAAESTAAAKTEQRKSFQMRRPTAKRDRAIILLLLDFGIRVSECARLRLPDVNLKIGEIHIQPFRSSRKSKPRTIPMGSTSIKAIWNYLSLQERTQDDFLFLTQENRPMDKDLIRLVLSEIGTRANVAGVHPHRFRHTFAIEYLRNGGDVFTLKRIMGLSSLKMIEVYLTIAKTDLTTAHRKASPADNWRL